ncbi:MAG: P-loop NTPase fold protein [Snowella sp.]
MALYQVQNQWGGDTADWNEAGQWVLGDRDNENVVELDIKSDDGGQTLNGTMTYSTGKGPIGFRATFFDQNNYRVKNQFGGDSAPWFDIGMWVIGDRDSQRVVELNIKSDDNGQTLHGTMTYSGEGPIGFKGTYISDLSEESSEIQESLQEPFAKFDSPVRSIAISPDGRSVVAALIDRHLELCSLRKGDTKKKSFWGHKAPIRCVSFSPDGQILVSGCDDHTIKLWNVETGEEIRTLTGHEDIVWSVNFYPNGKTLASSSDDYTIKLWNVETGEEIRTFTGHEDRVWSVSFSPDGQTLASGSNNHTIKLWSVETGEELLTLTGHEFSVSFSPDGQTLASGSNDRTIKLWSVETGEELLTLTGHEGTVYSVSFSPDGQTLASGSGDETIKLWKVATGEELLTLTGHKGPIWSVEFITDGQTLASGGEDNTIRLWDVKTGKQLSSLPQLLGLPKLLVKSYIGQELQNDLAQGDDQLSIKTEIDALTNVLMLRELKPPLAVGILGGWGSGKSFALHLMKQRINEIRSEALTEKQAWGESDQLFPYVGHIYQIEFDAWTYAKADLWSSLMQTILYEFNRQLTLEKQIEQQLGGKKNNSLLEGHKIWKALNKMNDRDREIILSKLSKLKEENNTDLKGIKSDGQITDYL